jgi:hypothetical protein
VSRRTEVILVVLIVAAVQVLTWYTQPRIQVSNGRGYDGEMYYALAEQFVGGQPLSGPMRFARRVGTPFLASLADPVDLVNGFFVVNVAGAAISALLLLLWLRAFLQTPWLRVALVLLFATHWLQLVRFTFFYPVLVDQWSQIACFAGLNCITWYERRPGLWPAVTLAVVSAAGICFRELVLLVPAAFLFARNIRVDHLTRLPYVRLRGFPAVVQWVPLFAAVGVLRWLTAFVTATDEGFSSGEHLLTRAYNRQLITFVLGWLVAFGPALFVVMFDWRGAVEFLRKHQAYTVYLIGVLAVGWAGSLESERHALYSAAPIVYVLLGRTVERHQAWFRSWGLIPLLAAQAMVHRVMLITPQPDGEYQNRIPDLLLTPFGLRASYLHLFPSYIPMELVFDQFLQFVLLAALVWFWLGRRAALDAVRCAKGHDSRNALVSG